jgi:hypothetical protein
LARSGFCTSGSPTEIWVWPARWISGSATPSESTRLRIVSMASSTACGVTSGTCGVATPSYTSSMPPSRSRPSFVSFDSGVPGTITSSASTSSAATAPRIDRLRVRLVIVA